MMKCSRLCFCFLFFLLSSATPHVYAATAHCDFNNDGFDDLAIGVPREVINGHPLAGAVQVLYGRPGGLSATNNQLWSKDSPNVLGTAADFEEFGSSVACGDFDGDSFSDLVIGAPQAYVNGHREAGTVTVLYGSSERLKGARSQLWTQDSAGIQDSAQNFDRFGVALAAGDFNGDGFEDLVIVASNESFTGDTFRGAVHVLYGTSSGLASSGNQFWQHNTPGLLGSTVAGHQFGFAIAAGNFGNDSSTCYDDLVISGVYTIDGSEGAGAINVLYGSASGLTTMGNQFLHENTPGIPDSAQTSDSFGIGLAAGSFRQLVAACGTSNISDLAVGARGKTVGTATEAGAVFVLYGTLSGLSTTDSQVWTQNSAGIPDSAETNDLFGNVLTTGHRAAGGDFLAIGIFNEGRAGHVFSGAVHVLFPDPATGLISATGNKYYDQGTPGIKDKVEDRDHFGAALASGDYEADGQDDLAIGASGETLGGLISVGAVNVLYDADTIFTQFFHQNSVDMKGVEEESELFGAALAQ